MLITCRGWLLVWIHHVVVAAGSCDRSFQCDCSQHIPSRGAAHAKREQLCPLWQTRTCLVRIPHRREHSIQSVVWVGLAFQAATSTVTFELAPTGGISSCLKQLGSNNRDGSLVLWCLLFSACSPSRFSKGLVEPLCRAGAEVVRPIVMPLPVPDTPHTSYIGLACTKAQTAASP